MRCDRCNRKIKAEESVYSPFRSAQEGRRVNYCAPAAWKRCDELFKKALSERGNTPVLGAGGAMAGPRSESAGATA